MKITDHVSPLRATRGPVAAVRTTNGSARVAPVDVEQTSVLGIPGHELTPRVREALLTLMHEVEVIRRQLEETQSRMAELEKIADSDTLTPVANRRAFVRELARVLSYAERYQVETSLLFIDVNDLKSINDRFGHAAGDAALIHVAHVLSENVRTSDVVGRLGGDEYAVILSHASEEQAIMKGDQLQAKIGEEPVVFEGKSFMVSAAIGIHTFGPHETPTSVLAAADQRMYARKKAMKAGLDSAK